MNSPEYDLVVIGAGYIGIELGSVWKRLGSRVTILEALPRIMPGMDGEIAQLAQRTFEKQGLQFRLESWVEGASVEGDHCIVRCKGAEPIETNHLLIPKPSNRRLCRSCRLKIPLNALSPSSA